MCSDSADSSELPKCTICLDSINSRTRSTARLACGHEFHLDCIGSHFNCSNMMKCPICRRVQAGDWNFAAGGHDDQDMEPLDYNSDDEYVDMTPFRRALLQNPVPNLSQFNFLHNGLPNDLSLFPQIIPEVTEAPRTRIQPAGTQTPSWLSQHRQYNIPRTNQLWANLMRNLAEDLRQSLGSPVSRQNIFGYGYIDTPQGQAPGSSSGLAPQPFPPRNIRPMVHATRVVPQQQYLPATADEAALQALFLQQASGSTSTFLNHPGVGTSSGQSVVPFYSPDNARPPHDQHVIGQYSRMPGRYQSDPSTRMNEDYEIPYRFL